MTQAANKKISPMLHSWKWNVRANKKMMIILTVLHMLAAPAVFLSVIIGILSTNGIDDPDVYIGIGSVTTCAAGFMGIIIGVNSFNCLHKKSVVDMKLSLPMTADQRFVSDFLSGLFVYLAPFLAAQVIALLLAGSGLIFFEGKTLYEKSYYGNLNEYTCGFFSDATIILLKLILCGILVMLMLYTLTVLITVCCGSKFEAVAYSIGVNIVIPVTILIVTLAMLDGLFGIDEEYSAIRLFLPTSPVGGIVTAFIWTDEYIYDYMPPAVWAVLTFLLTAAMGVLAFFLYRRRRAEQVSKPFVFKLAYYIVITGVVLCICSGFAMDESIIPAIITTAVIYLIAEAVTNRGFKRFWLSAVKYIATVIAAYIIIFIGLATDGFGALWYVPAGISVRSAEISYHGVWNDFDIDSVTIKDRENIKAVTDAHKAILDDYKGYLNSSSTSRSEYYDYKILYNYTLTIKYRLAGGRTVERAYYRGMTPEVAEILSSIDYTDEYKKQVAEYYVSLTSYMKERFQRRLEKLNDPGPNDTPIQHYNIRLYRISRYSGEYSNDIKLRTDWLYERNFFDRLADALSADAMAISESNYYLSDPVNSYSFYRLDDGLTDFYIPKSFVNTLRLLEEYGFEIP